MCAEAGLFVPRGLNVIRKEAWLFCRISSGVRLCWELEKPEGPKGPRRTRRSGSKNAFSAVLSTEGRVVKSCWEKLKPKGSKNKNRKRDLGCPV